MLIKWINKRCNDIKMNIKRGHKNENNIWVICFSLYIATIAFFMNDYSYPIIISWSLIFTFFGALYLPHIEYEINEKENNIKFILSYGVVILSPILFIIIGFIGFIVLSHTSMSLYADRIGTWETPFLYQHSGFQFNYAKCVLSAENCLLDGFSSKNIEMIDLINVDDDFAPTGLLSQGLYYYTIVLIFFQLSWVVSAFFMVYIAYKEQSASSKMLIFFSVFTLCGIGIFQAHTLIAWGTNSGLLPIMGQPMPFIGRQGSHLILFLFPFIWVITFLFNKSFNFYNKV